jgi:hypothetical protein
VTEKIITFTLPKIIAPDPRKAPEPHILSSEDRCATRHEVKVPATLRRAGDRPFAILVRDISVAGFSCEAVTSMKPGALCWLNLPGLNGLQSEVAWNDGIMIGCGFSNLLNAAVLDRILASAVR